MWKVANFVANTSCSKVFFSSSALALGVLVTYPAGPKGIAVRKVQWLTGQFITQFANYTAALPIRLRSGHTEWGVHGEGSSSIPGRALELWTPAHATARLRRSSLGEQPELVQVNPQAELRGSCVGSNLLEAN